VTDRVFVESLRQRLEAEGALDAVVHAAGTFDLAPLAATDPDMFERMVAANLTSVFLLIRAFLPGMLAAGRGQLVTIGSVAGRVAFPGNGAYSASKFGVRGLHAVLEQELQGSGVRCCLVEPAATATALWDPLEPESRPDLPDRAEMLSPGAVADAVLYVLSRPPEVRIPVVAVQRS
jgi:NADP-dependent 3-hydroxy acid dehydrogenase YdfG